MLSGFRSTQILTVLSFLGMTTIPAHQGVGSEVTPKDSMCATSPSPSCKVAVEHSRVCGGQMVWHLA